jgi:hypothetical protein
VSALILAYPSLAFIALGVVLIDLCRVLEYSPRHAMIETDEEGAP